MYGLEKTFQVSNIRQRTAEALAAQFNLDRAQAERVRQTARLLSEQFSDWKRLELTEEMREILLWAALLHEVGLVINHQGVQRHSAYILQNSELPGFDKEQQRLLATLIRFHIKPFKLPEIGQFARYDNSDVLALLRLLRLAVLFNKSRQASAPISQISLKTDRTSKAWQLKFAEGYLSNNPLNHNELQLEQSILRDIGIRLDFE